MKIVILKYFILLLVVGNGIGCRKFVSVNPPVTKLVTESVFNNTGSATAALTSIYSQMQSESYNMSLNTGLLGDEFRNYSSSNLLFYTNDLSAAAAPNLWQSAYSYIYKANAVIEGLQNFEGVAAIIKGQLTGEAKVLRAFWFFYLVNFYGDVPLVTSTDYSLNAIKSRTPKGQVFNQIILDLEDARNMLNFNYVDGSDSVVSVDRIRPNQATATALLARAYLYTSNFDKAIAMASAVINNTALYRLETELNNVFVMNSTETIWQLGLPSKNYITTDGSKYILTGNPTNVAISVQLLNTFESGDKRRYNWIDSVITTSGTFYFPYKYKIRTATTPTPTESVMMLRLSEQYLIRAEAYAQIENTANALSDLDTVRKRAGLLPYAGSTDKSALLAAILHERQVELFTEWGHRWLDLIRMGYVNDVMGGSSGVCKAKGGIWNSNGQQIVYPIPRADLQRDPNLKQNPGY
jgi:hypothetical protein